MCTKKICIFFLGVTILLLITLLMSPYSLSSFFNNQQENTAVQVINKPSTRESNPAYEVCETFEFARTEWTLYWKSKFDYRFETKYCSSLHREIYRERSVKWISYPNRTIHNLGCTRKTRACVPAAHFDKRFDIRINTPPCCRAKLLQMLNIVTEGFQRRRITHTLCGGAVIGWIRNRKLIPYDHDIDILVHWKHWRSKSFMKFLREISKKYGFFYEFRKDRQSMYIDYSRYNNNGIDLWVMKYVKKTRKIRIKNYSNKDQPYSNIYPPRRVLLSGIWTYVPNKPEKYCDIRYGKGKWEKELLCKKTSRRKCTG